MIAIRLAKPTEIESVFQLMRAAQPKYKRSVELLKWQYLNPNRIGKIYLAVNSESNQMLAVYCAANQYFLFQNQICTAHMIQDVMTHPDFRNQGLLHKLAHHCHQEMIQQNVIGYTFPNENSYRSFERTGWNKSFRIPSLILDLKNVNARASSDSILAIHAVNEFPKSVTHIWQTSGFQTGVIRDQDYLNWRYQKPDESYFRFVCEHGFMVLKLYHGTTAVIHILDLLVQSEHHSLIPEFLRFAHNFALQKQVSEITAWVPHQHPYRKHFTEFGFANNERIERYAFHLNLMNSNRQFEDGWHLSQGDSDLY